MAETLAATRLTVLNVGPAKALFADATLSPPRGDPREVAMAAAEAIAGEVGWSVPVLQPVQRHTARAYVYEGSEPLEAGVHQVGECDAVITAEPAAALVVVTADCLPIVLSGEGVVALVHAGWRGLAADILGVVVRRIGNEFGVPAAALAAAVGVGVGPCHYRVGMEVVEALRSRPTGSAAWLLGDAVDLAAWAFGRLTCLGLAPGAVASLGGCTACSPFHHSYRRDGLMAGRQWSAAVLRGSQRGTA